RIQCVIIGSTRFQRSAHASRSCLLGTKSLRGCHLSSGFTFYIQTGRIRMSQRRIMHSSTNVYYLGDRWECKQDVSYVGG
uniref:Uncharacterized protein n=1 Tax=Aegilops tauschii subsp. strangulata TaxID=200361 RepID=A0A453FWI9_AEGTS